MDVSYHNLYNVLILRNDWQSYMYDSHMVILYNRLLSFIITELFTYMYIYKSVNLVPLRNDVINVRLSNCVDTSYNNICTYFLIFYNYEYNNQGMYVFSLRSNRTRTSRKILKKVFVFLWWHVLGNIYLHCFDIKQTGRDADTNTERTDK
jgi:hypothetical protein